MALTLHSSSPTVVSLLATRQKQVANKKRGKRSRSPALPSGMSLTEMNPTIEHMPFIPLSQHHTGNYCKRAELLREDMQAILSGQLRYSPNRKTVPTWKVLSMLGSFHSQSLGQNHILQLINSRQCFICLSLSQVSQSTHEPKWSRGARTHSIILWKQNKPIELFYLFAHIQKCSFAQLSSEREEAAWTISQAGW